jgi:hypothetical protein
VSLPVPDRQYAALKALNFSRSWRDTWIRVFQVSIGASPPSIQAPIDMARPARPRPGGPLFDGRKNGEYFQLILIGNLNVAVL